MAVGAGSSSERSNLEKRRLREAKKAAGSKLSTTKAAVTFEATFTDEGPLGEANPCHRSPSTLSCMHRCPLQE